MMNSKKKPTKAPNSKTNDKTVEPTTPEIHEDKTKLTLEKILEQNLTIVSLLKKLTDKLC